MIQRILLSCILMMFVLIGCGANSAEITQTDPDTLPTFQPISSDGRLNVVATTTIIGDVVSQIGGDQIDLTVLIGTDKDAHSYQATPGDLVALENADIIFVNGWNLEEKLAETITDNHSDKFVSISTGITARQLTGESGHDDSHDDEHDAEHNDDHDSEHGHEGGLDPHVWFDISNVKIWAQNGSTILSMLDPDSEGIYQANLNSYLISLSNLEEEIDTLIAEIPVENRKLVSNHEAFGYFVDAYDFENVGAVIPSTSTNAEPSASDLADLVKVMQSEGVCTVFGERSQSRDLAETVTGELSDCAEVKVLALYTEAIGEGEANSYIGMYRHNVETIVDGLK